MRQLTRCVSTHAVFYAKDYQTGLKKGRALIARYEDRYPQVMECPAESL